jgi:MFS family permease
MPDITAYIIGAILSLQTLCTCVISTIGQYIYAYYLGTYPIPPNSTSNWTTISPFVSYNFLKNFNDETKKCQNGDLFPDDDVQEWAQQRSADLFFWTNLYTSCPLIIVTYILGLYTPKLGHRFVLILPMIGTLIQFAIWLAIIYFHLPEYWWYIAAVIIGLSGSSSVLSMNIDEI